MKEEKYDKELKEEEKKYRWRMNVAWVVLAGIITWLVFNF